MSGLNGEESSSGVVRLSPLAATVCDLPGIKRGMIDNRNYVTQKLMESKISFLHRDFLNNGSGPPEPPARGIDASFEERANFVALSILFDLEQVGMGGVADSIRELSRCYEKLCIDVLVGEKKFPEIIGKINQAVIPQVQKKQIEGSFSLGQIPDAFREAIVEIVTAVDYGDGTDRVREEFFDYCYGVLEMGKQGEWCEQLLRKKGYLS